MKKLAMIGILFLAFAGGNALAADAPKGKPEATEVSQDQRKDMAAMHEKMAECLRSDKTMDECRDQMRAQGQGMMASGLCPMAAQGQGMGMHDHKLMKHRAKMQGNSPKE